MIQLNCVMSDSVRAWGEEWKPVIAAMAQRAVNRLVERGWIKEDKLALPKGHDVFSFTNRVVYQKELRKIYCLITERDGKAVGYFCVEQEANAIGVHLPDSDISSESINDVLGQIKNAANN